MLSFSLIYISHELFAMPPNKAVKAMPGAEKAPDNVLCCHTGPVSSR